MTSIVSKLIKRIRRLPSLLSRILRAGFRRDRLFTLNRHESYEDYVRKQVEKTTDPERIEKWKTVEWDSKVQGYVDVFSRLDVPFERTRALCLGSRTGQEVYALQTLGADAQGIDLVAFPPFTIQGDVHDLRFEAEKFELVFSNIFDHVLYPEKFSQEARRVLAPGGLLVLRVQLGYRGDDFSETFVSSEKPILELFSDLELISLEKLHSQFDAMERQFVFRKP
jgi:SAM-dependent methyltransferase